MSYGAANSAHALQNRIRTGIPLSESMQFQIASLDAESIEVIAPLAPNLNVHGTAFAGSIYSLAILAGWALATHIVEEAGADADVVVARAKIAYRTPIADGLRCVTRATKAEREAFIAGLNDKGKGFLQLEVEIGKPVCATLEATYCALAP